MLHNFEFIRTSGCADMKIRRKSIFDLKTSLLSRRWLVNCALSTLLCIVFDFNFEATFPDAISWNIQ